MIKLGHDRCPYLIALNPEDELPHFSCFLGRSQLDTKKPQILFQKKESVMSFKRTKILWAEYPTNVDPRVDTE